MERLTDRQRNFDGTASSPKSLVIEEGMRKGMPSAYCGAIVTKLADYEDADEQGLLLKLPCKIGDTAWVIDEDGEYPGKKKIYEAKWKRVNFVQTSANHTFELRGEVGYQIYDWFSNDGRTMPYGMYVGQTHTKVGEVVFLTKEEAEQALAKMKGGTRNV